MNFKERKISTNQAISILSKHGIKLDHHEAVIILDFLSLMAKNYDKNEKMEIALTQKRNRTK